MIPSEYKRFHTESSASVVKSNKSETPDALLQERCRPAQSVVSESLSMRKAEPIFADNYMGVSGFSSVFLDARSQEYLHLVKAISVMEKGPEFNASKKAGEIGPISRKKMTVDQLKQKKSELEDEESKKLRELDDLSDKICDDSRNNKGIADKNIACMLEILSDFHSSHNFIKCMFFIMSKALLYHTGVDINERKQRKLSMDDIEKISSSIRFECGEIVELIFRIILSRSSGLEFVSDHQEGYLSFLCYFWELYYVCNIVSCCLNVSGSNYCSPYFSPELPVKLALKSFGRFPGRPDLEREFLKVKSGFGNDDTLMVQPLHFRFLKGKYVRLEEVISHVKNGCQTFQCKDLKDSKNLAEYSGLLQFLHTATVCVLERSDQDARRLLEYYDYFSGLQPSAGVLKQYMMARCEEKSGAVDAASGMYQSLVSGENKVPVFEEWIACLEKLGDNDAVAKACMIAADYYRDKGIKWREEYYAHKATGNMLLMANREGIQAADQSTTQDEVDVSTFQSDVEVEAKASRSKKNRGKRKNKAKEQAESHATSSQYTGTKASVQSYPDAQPCIARKVKKDTTHVTTSGGVASDSPKPVNEKSQWDYWRELNDLFSDYYHLPHKYRDAVESLSREACDFFPNDIWILHSAGWGFHLIGNEQKAAELLLKGLREYLDGHFPEVKSSIPVNIYGNFESGLDRLKTHPEITPGSSSGLNVAAFLSSLAYVYRNLNKHYDADMRSIANWLNPSRNARKKEQQRSPFTPKVRVVTAEVDKVVRKCMGAQPD